MKYIKKYESFNLSELKKYIVYYFENNSADNDGNYFIDSITNISDGRIYYNMLYKYNEKNEKLEPIGSDSTGSYRMKEYIENIVFTSDDLDECLNFIKLYINTTKYNL